MLWSLRIPWLCWQGFAAALRRRRPGPRPAAARGEAAWRRDPLSHPALQAMTQRELGDLPFDPRRVASD